MKKLVNKLLLTICLSVLSSTFISNAQASLTPEEKGTIVRAILNGDTSVLGNLSIDNEAPADHVAFNCTCHALDAMYESACKYLPITQCHQVGNIICIPQCQ